MYLEISKVHGPWGRNPGISYIFVWLLEAYRAGRNYIKRFSSALFRLPLITLGDGLISCAFRHLKPRYGYVEQVEIDIRPRCDDGTLPENSPIIRWYNWLDDATGQCVPIRYQDQTCEMLRAQGFVDIEDTIIRLPINGWPSDPHQQNIGKWYNLGLYEATEAMGLGPLTRVYHLSAENVRQYARDVKTAVCNKNTHVYHLL